MDFYLKSLDIYINDISGVIFDKDGTLTDSNIYWAEIIKLRTKKLIDEYKIDKCNASLICRAMGLDAKRNLLLSEGPIALETRKTVIKKLLNEIGHFNKKINIESISRIFVEVNNEFKKKSQFFIKPIYPACEFVSVCKEQNLKLALITSDTEENAVKAINKLELNNKFDFIIGGDTGMGDKKNGSSALSFCDNYNLNPQKVICIGDAPADYIMAKNAKLKSAILVESGQIPLKDLLVLSKFSVSSLEDIVLV